MNTTACLVACSAAAAFSFTHVAHAARPAPAPTGEGAPSANGFAATQRTLWNQMGTDSGIATVSQNFESSFDIYDSEVADDFKVPQLHEWRIQEVDVKGLYFNGIGPANSENVTFYKDKHGLPGAMVADYPRLTGTDNGTGSFAIVVPTTTLQGGDRAGRIYWLAVQANMDFAVGGEWGWENETTVRLHMSVWENPGGGFGVGCRSWTPENFCIPNGQGDQMFVIEGEAHARR